MRTLIIKLALSLLGKKIFFALMRAYVDSPKTQIDGNVTSLLEKLLTDGDIRVEVAFMTQQLAEKYLPDREKEG